MSTSSLTSIFVRDYRAYLEKKRSTSIFCKKSKINAVIDTNIVDPFCKKLTTQGNYLLFKTYQVAPCQIPIVKPNILCASCENLNYMYNETSEVMP